MRGRHHEFTVQLVLKRVDELAEALANGAATDFADYKYRAGYIAGLRNALELADDVHRKLTEG